MLKFKEIKIEDIDIYKQTVGNNIDRSCENSFVNLIVWQEVYNNMIAVEDGLIIIKSGSENNETFRFPFGKNMEKGYELILEYSKDKKTNFWGAQGKRFDKFKSLYGDYFDFFPERDAFDYLYLKNNLANLEGKKYHSKRNHISVFTKQHNWCYRTIDKSNIDDILKCAETWYEENLHRMDKYMLTEKKGIKFILENMEVLSVSGGAIYIKDKPVAFTLGSQICEDTFDIHIEKALKDYSTAYTVINREFAKRLPENIKYINREDDMGIEGLRKAKLSYKPEILIEKFRCVHK